MIFCGLSLTVFCQVLCACPSCTPTSTMSSTCLSLPSHCPTPTLSSKSVNPCVSLHVCVYIYVCACMWSCVVMCACACAWMCLCICMLVCVCCCVCVLCVCVVCVRACVRVCFMLVCRAWRIKGDNLSIADSVKQGGDFPCSVATVASLGDIIFVARCTGC